MKNQIQRDYPFKPLPTPPHHPRLGITLVAIGKMIPLLWFIFFFAYFFLVWVPEISSETLGSRTAARFFIIVIYIIAFFFIRPFLAILVEKGEAWRQPDALSLLREDRRPPILFLRSFGDDELVDTTRSSSGWIPVMNTYERSIKNALKSLGPMISIGRPGENRPMIGAARFYVSDDEWQSAIRYFLEQSIAVVIMMGSTGGLLWEIETALQSTNPERLLIFFPYVFSKEYSMRWWYRFTLGTNMYKTYTRRHKLNQKMLDEHVKRYKIFHQQMENIEPLTLPESLGESCFLTFSSDGHPNLLDTKRPIRSSFFEAQAENEINFVRTLKPFLMRLMGENYRPAFVVRLIKQPIFWIGVLLLGILFAGSSIWAIFEAQWLCLPIGIAASMMVNISIALIMAVLKNR